MKVVLLVLDYLVDSDTCYLCGFRLQLSQLLLLFLQLLVEEELLSDTRLKLGVLHLQDLELVFRWNSGGFIAIAHDQMAGQVPQVTSR